MRVQVQKDRSAEIFSHQLLEIGNGKMPVDLTSGRISLPHNFCNFVASKEELVKKYFPIFKPIIRIMIGWVNELIASRMGNYMLRVPGSANQTIYISAQQMEPQKILYTHRHWEINHI
jgi:hypothetical protein